MATISNTIKKANGAPQANVLVSVTLSWDTDESPVARDADNDFVIQGKYETVTDLDGYWEVEVTSNEVIEPADSVYKITETLKSGERTTYFVSVPDGATPNYWVGDIMVSAPAWED